MKKERIKIDLSIDDIINRNGWMDFWDLIEEKWNVKSGIGEDLGRVQDFKYVGPEKVTIEVTAFYSEESE